MSFLTREHGKVRGVARGSRRLNSKFGAALETFSRAQVIYYEKEGRDLVTLDHADLESSPQSAATADLDVAWHLQYIAEVVEQVAVEGEPQPLLYRLLAAVGDAVASGMDVRLAACYFELWLLRLQGVLPDIGSCGECGRPIGDRAVVHAGRDAFLCRRCRPDPGHRPVFDRPVLRFLAEALRRSIPALAAAEVSPAVLATASAGLRPLVQRYVGREIRSVRFLDTLEALPR